jgi:hypothetical protein
MFRAHLYCAMALLVLLGFWMCWVAGRTATARPVHRGVPFAQATAEWESFYDAWEST